jgi:MFS family permease
VRSFDIEIAVLGRWLGLIIGIAGGLGFFFGGYIADHLGRAGHCKSLTFIALAVLGTSVLYVMMFLADTSKMTLLLFIIPAATSNVYLAPVLAQTQGLVSLRMRAVAAALMLLIINVIGLALGPWITGSISDFLQPHFANESMRYSLLIISAVVLPWAAWHFHRAGTRIDADLARATDND